MSRHGAVAGTEELRQEVDRARHDLGETVEALAAKADVKAMARERVDQARTRAMDAVGSARQAASSRASSARAAAASPQGAARARQGGAAVGAAGAAAALLTVWLRRRRAPAVRVLTRRTQRAPVKVRRTGAGRTNWTPVARLTGARRSRSRTPSAWTRR
ncbi:MULTISPECIES: DUF3618 domain-containing protein [Actinomadura]|uniref:DUF3618 domain-containing protein n=1 Tax=Actinomadura TaxID=1988 RepID=UPI00040ECB7F|nr:MULTISPECIES: DUF3618 domain-containing protein [Actinomadura]RSN51912.1 DUF3618 domain-containing protein [Actinomadura sp. WAC 06369]